MPADNVPASSASDGRWAIWYVPSGSNPLSAAILNGATAKKVTYSFTADGFNYGISQETVSDPRLTLIQDLSRPGRKSESLEVKYVRSTVADTADALFTEGLEGFLVIRRGVANSGNATVAEKVDVITFAAGAKRPDAPAANGIDTVTQTMFITAVTQQNATVVT